MNGKTPEAARGEPAQLTQADVEARARGERHGRIDRVLASQPVTPVVAPKRSRGGLSAPVEFDAAEVRLLQKSAKRSRAVIEKLQAASKAMLEPKKLRNKGRNKAAPDRALSKS